MNFKQFDICIITKNGDNYLITIPETGYSCQTKSPSQSIYEYLRSVKIIAKNTAGDVLAKFERIVQHERIIDDAVNFAYAELETEQPLGNRISVMVNSKGDARIAISRSYTELETERPCDTKPSEVLKGTSQSVGCDGEGLSPTTKLFMNIAAKEQKSRLVGVPSEEAAKYLIETKARRQKAWETTRPHWDSGAESGDI